ncbi:hypothetical protein QAD02_000216 [Eretmocerus hayati]|uniref:Uncharacterized protein n=1 Tax=Eretmocerus hayati TaxID=131215 RepID=A0ACC2NCT3_9HYME|nr:hypothetical protein QAD02_000216 [Eretmocerus hayati]
MPACGSEGTCLEGLWPRKSGVASPQCLGSPTNSHQKSHYNHQQPYRCHRHSQLNGSGPRAPRSSPTPSLIDHLISGIETLIQKLLNLVQLWISGWLWLVLLPLRTAASVLGLLLWIAKGSTQAAFGSPAAPLDRRCVLISGASTVQAVRLARHLCSAGARVILCEIEGPLALGRLSRACTRFYRLPRPGPSSAAEYVAAIRDIVKRERVGLYIPVSAASSAYYDALAKPHLERLGCECFVPGTVELAQLDDPVALLHRAQLLGLPVPQHRLLATGFAEAAQLYTGPNRGLGPRRHFALPAGPEGLRGRRQELLLPQSLVDFERLRSMMRADGPIRPWIVVTDPGGAHFVTCTTVRDSRMLANLTCRVDEIRGQLILERRPEVEQWLERFFSRSFGPGSRISGHLSFRLAATHGRSEELVVMGCRVGLGLAYLGHSEQQARLLWKPCRHRNVQLGPRSECLDERLVNESLDTRQALLLHWDPLPYCAYCCLQMPFRRLVDILGAQRTQHKPPLAVVQ